MRVDSPHDLPDFRLWLIEQWREGGPLAEIETIMQASGYIPSAGPLPAGVVEGRAQRQALPRAALWWVAADMVELVAHAAQSLPETTLTEDLLPDDDGLVVFASPLVGTMADTGEDINTDAMVWCRGRLRDGPHRGDDCITIVSYKHTQVGDDIGNEIYEHRPSRFEMWNPTGTATWIFGTDTERIDDGYTAQQRLSTSEDRRWLAALWLLASQPLAESTTTRAPRAAARPGARSGRR